MQKSIRYSQNFITDQNLIQTLLKKTSINKDDLVLEIGAGKGFITKELSKIAKNVIALEIDRNFINFLKKDLATCKNLDIVSADFLPRDLPAKPYKVFSNIPFNITAEILHKLMNSEDLIDCYLFVQKEAALKYTGAPHADETKETMQSVLHKPLYEFEILHNFHKSDFTPETNVDIVLLRILPLKQNFIKPDLYNTYKDFVSFLFNNANPTVKASFRKIFTKTQVEQIEDSIMNLNISSPAKIPFGNWLKIFDIFDKHTSLSQKQKVKGWRNKMLAEELKTSKINRTRTDANWTRQKSKTAA